MADFVRMPKLLPPQDADQRPAGLSCRIAGQRAPQLAVSLAQGQAVLIDEQALLWKEPSAALSQKGGLLQVQGPGDLGLSRHAGGAVFPVPLMPGESLQLRAGRFLLAYRASYARELVQGLGDRLTGAAGLAVDRFTAGSEEAVIWVQAQGDMFERELLDGEVIDVGHGMFLAKDATVGIESVAPSNDAGARFEIACLRLTGPGRVAFQTEAAMPSAPPVDAARQAPAKRSASFFGRN